MDGTFQNLGVHLADAGIKVSAEKGGAGIGGIVGNISVINNSGHVILRNCYVTGNGAVEATSTEQSAFAGGIVGYIDSPGNGTVLLTHCYTTVNVTATTAAAGNKRLLIQSQAGGIAGSSAGTLSYAYATGKITAKGGDQYAGGISGSALGQLTNCLALNPEITVEDGNFYHHRIAGFNNGVTTASNYANPDMKLSSKTGSKPVSQTDVASLDGADTWLDTFANDLQGAAPNEWGNAWAGLGSANLPQLKIAKGEGASPTYDTWPNNPQPMLPAKDYLRNKPVAPPTPPVTEPDDDDEPTVYYTVTLPAVEGVTTDPVAGDYEVEAWDSFRFYLTVDTAYSQSEPVVTTSRGDVIVPRSSDGAYIVSYVRSDLEIFIAGIDKNPVANEAIRPDATRVWCADGTLHIRTAAPTDVRIYTFAGTLHRAFRSDGGEQRVELAPGSYILRIGNESFKVIL